MLFRFVELVLGFYEHTTTEAAAPQHKMIKFFPSIPLSVATDTEQSKREENSESLDCFRTQININVLFLRDGKRASVQSQSIYTQPFSLSNPTRRAAECNPSGWKYLSEKQWRHQFMRLNNFSSSTHSYVVPLSSNNPNIHFNKESTAVKGQWWLMKMNLEQKIYKLFQNLLWSTFYFCFKRSFCLLKKED